MPDSTLTAIRTKVRRLTGRPSTSQITDAQIDEYINTYYLYDMPETLRLFSLSTVFEFMTTANVAEYDLRELTVEINGVDVPAVDIYYNIDQPVYIAGYQSFWSQDREQFFRIYPQLAEIQSTIDGNGSPGPYTFTLSNSPILQNLVTVGAIDTTGNAVNVIDDPQTRASGNWVEINTTDSVVGSVDYLNGTGTITFANSIPAGNTITVTGVPYEPNRPQALLYYDNTITLRPVPDQSYLVQVNAYRLPTELLASSQNPEMKQWWQLLAYGATKKIFEDAQDPEGVSQILMGLKEQERLVLRRTLVQQTNQRTATIYTEQSSLYPYGNFGGRF